MRAVKWVRSRLHFASRRSFTARANEEITIFVLRSIATLKLPFGASYYDNYNFYCCKTISSSHIVSTNNGLIAKFECGGGVT